MKTPTVLIAYSQEDLDIAKQLENSVPDLGLALHPDQAEVHKKEQSGGAVGQAVSSSDLLLVLWSRSAADSSPLQLEWTTALALNKTIIPCLLDETPLPEPLRTTHSVSLKDFEEGVSQIRTTLHLLGLGKSKQPAPATPADVGTIIGNISTQTPHAEMGTIIGDASAQIPPGAKASTPPPSSTTQENLIPGQQIGTRYTITRLIGRGGMGAVYQAYDNDLERDVAVKVIRADLVEDASLLQRFKREIQLSSSVTHKNVLRVYDLGESNGLKFLTMQFVEGEDLAGLFKREGQLPMERVLDIFRQICEGLAAAHGRGILHRDLKPANIMIDKEDVVYLTDFGLAKSILGAGLTQTGEIMGTPDYMSPEQVKGETLDVRSDLYSLGIILYQMVTNRVPYSGNTAFEVMIQRVQKSPQPASELNPDLPSFVDKIIKRCMAMDKQARYASIEELLADLEQGRSGGRAGFSSKFLIRRLQGFMARLTWRKAAFGLPVVLLLILGGWWFLNRMNAPPLQVQLEPITVLIADFDNQTGDEIFDGALEEIMNTGLEGASFLTTFNRGQARTIGGQIQEGAKVLDENLAMLVATREGIDVILGGSISSENNRYQITARALDALNGELLTSRTIRASKKEDVPSETGKLSAQIRRALGDTTPESVQMAEAETFTTRSLEAARSYAQAQEVQGNGQWEEAISYYEEALDYDPEMGRALAGIAVMYRNLGQREKAEDYYNQAMAKIDRMMDREKYRTRGGYFVTVGNYEKAIEEYSELVKKYPADAVGHSNLALSYFSSRKMDAAFEEARRAVEIFPKNAVMRTGVVLLSMYAGDFETALREAKDLQGETSYWAIFVIEALSKLALGRPQEAMETYQELQRQGPPDSSVAVMGLADVALYEGRFKDAVEILREGISQDGARNDVPAAARKSAVLAWALLQQGNLSSAFVQAEQAVAESSDLHVVYYAARVFLEGGREARALELAAELGKSFNVESKAYEKLIEGEAKLKNGEVWEAIRLLQESQNLADTWLVRLTRGRANLEAPAYTEAYSEFEQCQERVGEAAALFLDEIPTIAVLPPLYYYMGRAQEELGSPEARESYRRFLQIKEKSEADPMVEEVRQKLAAE